MGSWHICIYIYIYFFCLYSILGFLSFKINPSISVELRKVCQNQLRLSLSASPQFADTQWRDYLTRPPELQKVWKKALTQHWIWKICMKTRAKNTQKHCRNFQKLANFCKNTKKLCKIVQKIACKPKKITQLEKLALTAKPASPSVCNCAILHPSYNLPPSPSFYLQQFAYSSFSEVFPSCVSIALS